MLHGAGGRYSVRDEPQLESGVEAAGRHSRPVDWRAQTPSSARFRGHAQGGREEQEGKGPKRVPMRLLQTFAAVLVAGVVLIGSSTYGSSLLQTSHRVCAPIKYWVHGLGFGVSGSWCGVFGSGYGG